MKRMTLAVATLCVAVVLTFTAPAAPAQDYSYVRGMCEQAMALARARTNRGDVRHDSWKVEDGWYEKHRVHDTNWEQYRCQIAAQCPQVPWPYPTLDGTATMHGTEMRHDDPRRVWVHTGFSGSLAEAEEITCTEGGYLR